MTTPHTPGPWSIDDTGYRTEGGGVCIMAWPNCVAIVGHHNQDLYNEADARLIAAAPDLFEALDGMLQVYGVREQNIVGGSTVSAAEVELCNQARAAIAKARGAA